MKRGFADLHCHPMVHHAFGGRSKDGRSLFWGDPLAELPEGMGTCTHAHLLNYSGLLPWLTALMAEREGVRKGGFDAFQTWPNPRTTIHQQMHISQVKRAWEGGLRLMVACAVNNELLGDYYQGKNADDADRQAIDVQLAAIRAMVLANSEFMQIVESPGDARKALDHDKVSVILAIEVDSIAGPRMRCDGQLAKGEASKIVKHWWSQGVRLIVPIHLADNALGGAAVYNDMFNCLNDYLMRKHASKLKGSSFFEVQDATTYPGTEDVEFVLSRCSGAGPFVYGMFYGYPNYAATAGTHGHINRRGLSDAGREFITCMMAQGMLIDVEHMSTRSFHDTLDLAEAFDYPILSTHTGLRSQAVRVYDSKLREWQAHEAMRSDADLKRIQKLGGLLGLGGHLGATRNNPADESTSWARCFHHAVDALGFETVCVGTDMNGFARSPGPRFAKPDGQGGSPKPLRKSDPARVIEYGADLTPFQVSPLDQTSLGTRSYDLNFDGFCHYGLLPDFLTDVALTVGTGSAPDWNAAAPFVFSAEGVIKAWSKCEAQMAWVPRC